MTTTTRPTRAKKTTTALAVLLTGAALVAGCSRDADVASRNLSEAADNFEVMRRVVFFNGITDEYLLTVEGRCAIVADGEDGQLEVTCKLGDDAYKKHFLGLSDNVTYFVEQLDAVDVSEYHYRVAFKPQSILPNLDVQVGNPNED